MQKELLAWYDKTARSLPWRLKKPDPYKTWISEIMLQQTQVDTVLPYFQKFLDVFPDIHVLAEAPVEKVLTLWSGLGYYSRARNLHKTAKMIVFERGGCFPRKKEELLKLPGIGEYTAGAVASIAFEERVPVLDGNVMRVLTRVFALKGNPKKKPLHSKLWKLAADLLPPKRIGNYNQSLMELGSLVCTPKSPKCMLCPLCKKCRAYKEKKQESYPTALKTVIMKEDKRVALLIRKNGYYLVAKRNDKRHLESMWEFPQGPLQEKKALLEGLGLEVSPKGSLPIVRHAIMNRAIRLKPHLYIHKKGRPEKSNTYVEYKWIKPAGLKALPTSSINHKIIRRILPPESRPQEANRKSA